MHGNRYEIHPCAKAQGILSPKNDKKETKMDSVINFSQASDKVQNFVRNIAHYETGFWFTVEQLTFLLGNEIDELLTAPFNNYNENSYLNLDTFDVNFVSNILHVRLFGVIRDNSPIDALSVVLIFNDDREVLSLPKKIHTVDDVNKHYMDRTEIMRNFGVTVGEFLDEICIKGDAIYVNTLIEFLQEEDNVKILKERFSLSYQESKAA
jgi:hypothetical protein